MRVVPKATAKGSQKWLQLAVAEHWDDFEPPLLNKLKGATEINWISPIIDDQFAEYRDAAFLRQLGLAELADGLRDFWPLGGPQWDGLARSNADHILLVEAKAHIGEFCSTPSQASDESLQKICVSLGNTAAALGAKESHIPGWSLHFYQYANRLAHLHWLRERGIDAKLVLVGFINDSEMPGTTTPEAWEAAYLAADYVLGLSSRHRLSRHVIHVYSDVTGR